MIVWKTVVGGCFSRVDDCREYFSGWMIVRIPAGWGMMRMTVTDGWLVITVTGG